MANIKSFLAGATVGAAAGMAAGAALSPHLRSLAKTAIGGLYAGSRHAAELAARVVEELEDIHSEVVSESEAAKASADNTTTTDTAARDQASTAPEGEDPAGGDEPLSADLPDEASCAACEGHEDTTADQGSNEEDPLDRRSYEDMSVSQLRDELVSLGVAISSRIRKGELVAMLQAVRSDEE